MFLDESGFSRALYLFYGWGPVGERLWEAVPACRGKNLSVLGAFDWEGMIVTRSKLGAMKRADLEALLRRDLLPRLLPGPVLVLDTARIHHGGNIDKIACSPRSGDAFAQAAGGAAAHSRSHSPLSSTTFNKANARLPAPLQLIPFFFCRKPTT